MKKLFLTLLFIGLCAVAAFSQDETANQRLVKVLDALEKAETLNASQQTEIEALKKLVKTLEDSQRTPCTIAFDKVKNDLTYWLAQIGSDETKNKEVLKILKDVRKQGRRAIASQCGANASSVWTNLWEVLKVAAPITAAVLIANE